MAAVGAVEPPVEADHPQVAAGEGAAAEPLDHHVVRADQVEVVYRRAQLGADAGDDQDDDAVDGEEQDRPVERHPGQDGEGEEEERAAGQA